jgi:hypothetical protein
MEETKDTLVFTNECREDCGGDEGHFGLYQHYGLGYFAV